jgi:hypothetical protein
MSRLYANREATCEVGNPDRRLLQQARAAVDRVEPRLRRNPVGVPTFLLGGAFVSSGVSALSNALDGAKQATPVLIALVVVAFLLFLGTAWAMLRGAAVARRRIVLTTETPMKALWETIGRCGNPPKDQSRQLLLFGLIATILAWVLIPSAVVFVILG